MSYWTVVQTAAHMLQLAEGRRCAAQTLFERIGFESYLPQTKAASGKIAPLFPGYIFVLIDSQWYRVAFAPGVIRMLKNGDQPSRLPARIIDELRLAEVRGVVPLPPPIPRGTKVRVLSGTFCGQVGLYEGQSSRQRERVLLSILGGLVPVELSAADSIELAEPAVLR